MGDRVENRERALEPADTSPARPADETTFSCSETIERSDTLDALTPFRPPSPSDDELTPGSRVGRFIVLHGLGRGGMGVVYAAYDPELGRNVALKLIRASHSWRSDTRLRLFREAQAMAKLAHPNVVTVYDVGTHEGEVWLAMELIAGRTLRAWRAERQPGWRAALDVMIQVARGVAAAHAAGLLHRDLKPDNVMVDYDGRVRVMDFGLARAGEERGANVEADDSALVVDVTSTHAIIGTPAYMAPEQLQGLSANSKSDQYALSVTLWETLYGQRLYSAESYDELVAAVTKGARPRPPAGARAPRWLRRALERGLMRDPAARHTSVDALRVALESDPTRRRVAFALGVALVAVTAGWWGAAHVQHALAVAACEAHDGVLSDIWNDVARSRLERALLSTDAVNAEDTVAKLLPQLDAYVVAWSDARKEICRAETVERTWDQALTRAGEACLSARRERFASTIEFLSAPGDSDEGRALVQNAVPTVSAFPPVTPCTDARSVQQTTRLPDNAAMREEVRRIRSALTTSAALEVTSRLTDALALAERAQTDSDALGWAPLRAEARLRRGELLSKLARYEAAEETLESAYVLAGGAGDDIVAATAAIALARMLAASSPRFDDGARWITIASMQLDRAGLDATHDKRAELLSAAGRVHQKRGDYRRALECIERALEIREAALGGNHPRVAELIGQIGTLALEMRALERAVEYFERALAISEDSLGAQHLALVPPLTNLGIAHDLLGEPIRALPLYRRALAIESSTLGPDHPDLASTLTNIGTAQLMLGDNTGARASYERARELLANALGSDHFEVAFVLGNLAEVASIEGDYDSALTYAERSIAGLETHLGPEHPDLVTPLLVLGECQQRSGDFERARESIQRAIDIETKTRPGSPALPLYLALLASIRLDQGFTEEARGHAERALAQNRENPGESSVHADILFILARTLWPEPALRARAREHAAAARDGLPEGHSAREPIITWLNEHVIE